MRTPPAIDRMSAFPAWLKGILLVALPWSIWVCGLPRRTLLNGLIEVGFPALLAGLCFWALWRASRRASLPATFRASLRWIAAGWASTCLAVLFVLLHDVLLHWVAGPGVGPADLLYLAAYPLILTGLVRLPRAGPPLPGPWRILLDSAAFIFGVGAPLWIFALRPALGHAPGLDVLVSLAYTCLAFGGVFIVDLVLLRCLPLPSRTGFNLVLAGTALSWMSDLMFSLGITQQMKIPSPFHITNLITALSMLLILGGAHRILVDPLPSQPQRPTAFSPVPMFSILVVAIWLVGLLDISNVSKGTIQGILMGVIVLLLVLLLREGMAARDSLRQATEAVTATLRARFEALVQHSSDLILVVDREGRCTFSSPAAARFFGAQWPEGQFLSGYMHPEDLEPWTAFLTGLQNSPEAKPVRQLRVLGPEGEWRILEISGSNLFQNPDVAGLVLNARDITDRHRLENQLRQVMKMDALGRLAGGVSHDFNNLLCSILGNVELARMKLPEDDPLLARLSRIEGAASRGAMLTGRLLSFTRQDSALTTILGQKQVLEGLRQLTEGLLGEQIQMEIPLETGMGCFQGNLGDVEQGLLNLVINARDAMPAGGQITVSARDGELTDPGQMTFLAPSPGRFVVLEVTDTGIGMDAGVRSHLFEPFFTTKGKEKGTGLGLIGVYGMLKVANGGIVVRSEPGHGTSFQLWFPSVAAPAPEASSPRGSGSLLGSETLLLVEDEEGVREAAKEILDSLGYRVFVAGNADEARAFLKGYEGELHLLVTDVIMPGDSGPKLAAELLETRPDLRVLFISGYTAGELVAQGLGHPGHLLLEKPFRRDELGRRLREVLEGPARRP